MRFVMVVFFAMILAGCATGGQPLSQKAATQIQEGVTTREDLLRLFGPSMYTSRDEHGRTILSWGYSQVGVMGAVAEGLSVIMSDEGRAIGYHLKAGPSASAMRTIIKRDAPPPETNQVAPVAGAGSDVLPIVVGKYCDSIVGAHYLNTEKVVPGKEAITSDGPLFDGGSIKCTIDKHYALPQYVLTRVEEGSYGPSGTKYRIYYRDGSGTVQGDSRSTLSYAKDRGLENWSLRCKADKINDTRWCSISKKLLQAGIWNDGSSFISVGYDHYPGSDITVRIDSRAPHSASAERGFGPKQVGALIAELSSGRRAITRYVEWPYRSDKDTELDLFGFSDAFAIAREVHSKHSR